MTTIPNYFKVLGRKGGKAGSGKSKKRGDSEYYRQLSAKAVRAKKRAARLRKSLAEGIDDR